MSGIGHAAAIVGEVVLTVLVLVAAVPLLASAVQTGLAVLHGYRNHYGRAAPFFPRTAVLIPAWNEAAVIAASIDRLMRLEYPPDALRVYVIDDASTDETPEVLRAKAEQYPGRVVHLRREKGGEGKAHTLNHGLAIVETDDWVQAVLVMDADVIYLPDSLRRMAWHLADPKVGAVTAYIREGSRSGNYLTRFIGYEYITAQAAGRRGQNVLGVLACLAGGAQLLSRANLVQLGWRIDTTSLAEDTFTTFNTQIGGRRAIFEPRAEVLAEEPQRITALWKQRVRWARGNVQVTLRYRRLWFRRGRSPGLGGFWFGVLWFSLFLQPMLLLAATASLITLYFTDHTVAYRVFSALWITNLLAFLFTTAVALMMDPTTGRRVWRQAVLFPGIVTLLIFLYQLFPPLFTHYAKDLLDRLGWTVSPGWTEVFVLFTYSWLTLALGVALLARVVEPLPGGRALSRALLYVGGFGPLLCTVTLAAYLKEFRGAEMTWDKTEKIGSVGP